ncbi:hypothetical protein [Actinoplanes sp. NPDC049599]
MRNLKRAATVGVTGALLAAGLAVTTAVWGGNSSCGAFATL